MTPPAERLFITWFTNGADRHSHAVTDEEAGHGYRTGTDPEALCGSTVTPMPLITPPGPRCPRCEQYLHARATMTDFALRIDPAHPRHHKPSRLRRLFDRIPPARSSSPP